ncbi:MAG TPA: AMP-binding protein, partial [Methylomirabilota bacterium]|nr:AMP-binding protein [Methylomirabilota bacterium]
NRLAQALVARGVRRGDRVAIYLPNAVEAVVAIFAALKADAVFVPVNRTTKAEKLLYVLNNCTAAALITDDRMPPNLGARLLQDVPSLRVLVVAGSATGAALDDPRWLDFAGAQKEFAPRPPARRNIDTDLACLIYTSGTTGEPKGVMSDHSNVVFASGSIISYLGNVEDDIVLNVLPLSFDYGLYQVLMTFRFGGTLVLENSFAYPAETLKRMVEERVTGFPGVPTIFAMLLNMDVSAFDLSRLRYVTNTAAALPPSHITAIRQKFPGVTLFSMYGLTETKRTLYLPPEWLDRKPGSVGIPIPGTEAWVEDEQGRRLGPGQVGELVVRGRHVMRGYWGAPEATAARFRPGPIPGERVCYSGDLFRMDEEGCFYFVGRKDDIIKSRGEKVAPREVENVLHALPGVVEAAVVGVPDPILGQSIKAVLVSRDPKLTANAVLAHCRAHLEDFMVPKLVEFRQTLPKSPSGKVRKEELL